MKTIYLKETDPLLAAAIKTALAARQINVDGWDRQSTHDVVVIGGDDAIEAASVLDEDARALLLLGVSPALALPHHYLVKPVRIGQLVDDVEKLLRRAPVVVIGAARLYPQARRFEMNGTAQPLTEKEVDILVYLADAAKEERAVSREELLENVWGYNPDITTHTLETHIYRLRQKIEQDPENPALLMTGEQGYHVARA